MKIFFLLRHSGYLRNYETAVKLLADRGHHIHLGIFKVSDLYKLGQIEGLLRHSTNITYGIYPRRVWLWTPLAGLVRVLQTYLRFLDKSYQNASKLRQRAASMLPAFICELIHKWADSDESKIWLMIKCLRAIERAIPLDRKITRILASYTPDIFLVTPLIDLRATQLDWVKSASFLRIKTGLCVASWDNLTNKSLIQTETDIVLLWNEYQKSEAISFHKISSSKISVTGAQCYDKWFEHRPLTSRKEFLNQVGLDPDRPYILYLCSSPFIAPDEVGFVMNWVEGLRKNMNSQIKTIGVLIRPHPQNALQWKHTDLSGLDNIVIYPRAGANPVDKNSVQEFFDSMYHCEAAVGINTSPMIEAGILEKPVFTILSPEFSTTQEGTLHFHYLVDGGLLNIGTGLEEHFDQLSTVLSGQTDYRRRIRRFVENFIRPHGLSKPSTPIFVAALEKLHSQSIQRMNRKAFGRHVVTALITPLAVMYYVIFWIAKRLKAKRSEEV
jgi:hypothetical protein